MILETATWYKDHSWSPIAHEANVLFICLMNVYMRVCAYIDLHSLPENDLTAHLIITVTGDEVMTRKDRSPLFLHGPVRPSDMGIDVCQKLAAFPAQCQSSHQQNYQQPCSKAQQDFINKPQLKSLLVLGSQKRVPQ